MFRVAFREHRGCDYLVTVRTADVAAARYGTSERDPAYFMRPFISFYNTAKLGPN